MSIWSSYLSAMADHLLKPDSSRSSDKENALARDGWL